MSPAPRLVRLGASAVAAGLLLSPVVLLAPAGAAPSPHSSCADVRSASPGAPDGEYEITSYGRTLSVWCADMATTPVEYLTLQRGGPGVNMASSNNNWSPFVQTHYTRIGLNLPTAVADPFTFRPADSRFSSTSDGFGPVEYGTGGSCGFAPGPFNIDLRGTPFAIGPDALVDTGWMGHGDVASSDGGQVLASPNARGDCGGLRVRAPYALTWIAAVEPVVGTSPVDAAVASGADAVFTAASTGGPGTTVVWQTSPDGSTWTDVPGATTSTLTLPDVTRSMDGLRVRAVFTNPEGSDTTDVATLSVAASAAQVTDPGPVSVTSGGTAHFAVTVTGDPAPTLRWETSTDGSTWTAVAGATDAALDLPGVTTADDGLLVRAVAENEAGTDVSAAAELTVDASLPTVSDPQDLTVTAGDPVSFSVTVSGDPAPTVRWQVAVAGLTGWTDTEFTGTELTLPDAPYIPFPISFRAVAINAAGEVFSAPAVLVVDAVAPEVLSAPAPVTVREGEDATFTVEADGDPVPSIQWQTSTDGATWTDVDGATDDSVTFAAASADLDGLLVRAHLENPGGSVVTDAVVLSVQVVVAPAPLLPGLPVPNPVAVVTGTSPTVVARAVVARAADSLPRTGSDAADLAVLAGLLVLGGGAALVASRRRPSTR
jgi:LPXTG-motif cell wall-anchored protein